MKISNDTKERLRDIKDGFLRTSKDVLEDHGPLALIGLSVWFGSAAIGGTIGSLFQELDHDKQKARVNNMVYMQESESCIVVDPTREKIVTVTGYTNSRFTQVLRAAAPVIARTEGKTVTLGTTPVYASVPCSTIKDGVTRYESIFAAKAAEYANAQALAAKLEEAQKTFNRTEDLTFTERPKAPQPQP
ncbi:MAG TPA: hypothetical protein PKX87_01940 [Alphaproteobacteria bacterium]|nr:hypothetical protein [Alphaproteobacteria bacterium]